MSSGKWEVDLGKCPSRIGIAQVAGGTSICVRSLDYLQGVSELSEPNAQLQPTRGGGNESLEIPATGVDGLGGKAFRPLWYFLLSTWARAGRSCRCCRSFCFGDGLQGGLQGGFLWVYTPYSDTSRQAEGPGHLPYAVTPTVPPPPRFSPRADSAASVLPAPGSRPPRAPLNSSPRNWQPADPGALCTAVRAADISFLRGSSFPPFIDSALPHR